MQRDATAELTERVRAAAAAATPLAIVGSGSKSFYGRPVAGVPLTVAEHAGVIDYDPQELVLSARAGTPLALIEALLAEQGQHMAFEPPHFGAHATLGGTIACGLAGPARPSAGAVRDSVLGVRILTGAAQVLSFEMRAAEALARMNDWALTALPVTGTAWVAQRLYVRLSGSAAALAEGRRRMGGEELADADNFWRDIREHTHPFFAAARDLWRLSVPSESAPIDVPGRTLLEWTGAQRWVVPQERMDLNDAAERAGGFATRFRGGGEVFAKLPAPLLQVHRELKKAFDPAGLFNPGRLYADF